MSSAHTNRAALARAVHDRTALRRVLTILLCLFMAASVTSATPSPAGAQTSGDPVPNPAVHGPTENGLRPNMWNASTFPLQTDDYEYREDEYFYSGTASYFSDSSTEEFTSRYVIRQPVDAADFNGIVLVDWTNVTNGQDWEYNWWPTAYDYAMRNGYAIVAVTAQSVGARHLRTWDPARYAGIDHPGDNYSFDIFAQAMQSLKHGPSNAPNADGEVVDPLMGREVEYLIGGGVSQSAGRLITFIDSGYNRGVVDAWHLERALGNTPENLETFVFVLNEETNFAGGPTAEQAPDSDGLRVWEEAGVSHHAIEWWNYTYAAMQRDLGAPPIDPVDAGCSVNRGTNGYSVRAMLHHTKVMFDTGVLPPSAPRIPRLEDGSLPRDEDGLVEGGLRHPFIEVPVAVNTADDDDCINWGHYAPFSDERILELHATHAEYVTKTAEWGAHQVDLGLLLLEDCEDAINVAYAFEGPWDDLQGAPKPDCPVPDDFPQVTRIAGEGRITTAVAVSEQSFPSGAPAAVIARADDFPDALTGAPLARSLGGPLLLTDSGSLPATVDAELDRLGVTDIRVLGGPAAISQEVMDQLSKDGRTVTRISGEGRFETAAAVADALAPTGGPIYLTSGDAFADAVSVGPVAATQGAPILLSSPTRLPGATAEAIQAHSPDEVVLVGGEQALSAEVQQAVEDLDVPVRRVAGLTRYETSVAVMQEGVAAGLGQTIVWLADGTDFPDALTAGPAAAADGGSLLLIDGQDVDRSPASLTAVIGMAGTVTEVKLVGGPAAISEATAQRIEEGLAGSS